MKKRKFSKNEITPHKQDNKQDNKQDDKLQTENKVIEISDKDKEKLESDQEKMILNLFDGKFIE